MKTPDAGRTSGAATRARTARLPAAARRAEILRRSARLFQLRGYTGVSIDDIGADIGISGPALYRHVTGKEAILFEIGAEFLDRLLAATSGALRETESANPDVTSRLLIDDVVDVALDYPSELTVTIRHMWSLNDERREQISGRWGRLGQMAVPAFAAAHPNLDPADSGLYVRAGAGVLLGFARGLRNVPRPRISAHASTALNDMLCVQLAACSPETAPTTDSRLWERSSRREQILGTAIALFRERGFRGVSMAEIAEAVGVTAAAPYRHFKNKEDILATAILRAGERVTIGMNEQLASATSAVEALDRLVRSYIDIAVANSDLFAVTATEWHHISADAMQQRRRTQQLIAEEWTHCLATVRPDRNGAEATAMVQGIVGMVNEAVRSRAVARRPHLADDLYALAQAMLHQPRTGSVAVS
ncbi:TetR/AcrR family transcriptional regulator [Aldersonia sp. NBC_00410]|uniref:TetR/AcrR family transcriptional regulator n=1 Tax=Aldersonia sp. NBC_00410 TaxID=2975954 RepID=UPI0022543C9B|nr:TetR/AcrR family transcriptional regulator [Aldersonia sp. NBC_00410]MCX5042139.1 TetR/AcrR family transcriptional regulator [Aldersonia sp. NBC_00410]